MCKSRGIAVGAEEGNFVVRGTECLLAFEALLAIVQARGHAMDAKVRVCYVFWLRPDASLDAVVSFNMATDCGEKVSESQKQIRGVRNTFAEHESNVVPVDCTDGRWWEDHFGKFLGEGKVSVWKKKMEDKGG